MKNKLEAKKTIKKIKIEYVLAVILTVLIVGIFLFQSFDLSIFSNNNSTASYEIELEKKLENTIKNVKGAGKTSVVITTDGTSAEEVLKESVTTYENGVKALKNVSFTIADGEFVFIVGPSGSGTSTLVKLLCAELKPTSGTVEIGEFDVGSTPRRHVPYLRREIGVVFQDFRLIENKTVYENVAFVMRAVGASMRTIRKRVPYVLELVGIDHKADCYPAELSGGEQQRVAVARALVNNPDVILADEPTGNLDPLRSLELMTLLSEINARGGTTVVVVTHAHEIVNSFKKRVIAIENGSVISDRKGGYFGTGRVKNERE